MTNPNQRTRAQIQSEAMSRRNFLKGAGACIAIPAFTSLLGSRALAALTAGPELATTATGAPLRTAFCFVPNGAIPAQWWPAAAGEGFALSPTLAPLQAVRKSVQVMGGLAQRNAIGGVDGGGDHARGNGVFLTSVRLNKSATDIRAGISIDQVMANRVGHLTRFSSLELCCDATRKSADCDSGYSCAYQYNLSWQSPSTPMPPEPNPRLAFERLFGEGLHGQRQQNSERRMMERKSILDFVMSDARTMQARMSSRDRDKLDQYLTGIRDVEKRILKAERFGPNSDPTRPTPVGVPQSEAEYVELMYDIMLLAFQTDSTRVATFVLGHDGDNRSFSEIGITEGHHDLSHHQGNPERMAKVAAIDKWYVEQFSRFLSKMDSIRDADGNTMLHNSQIVYGSGNADGNRHTHEDLPILMAGGAGGALKGDRYRKFSETPMSNLFLDMADNIGMRDLQHFGDSTGRLGLA
ncbi:MAG TPA: DUF1552 domain-containing protein [Opitutaceae bacterium]|jgi:hypothetical protein